MNEADDDVDLELEFLDEDELQVLDSGATATAAQSEADVLRTSITGMLECIGDYPGDRPPYPRVDVHRQMLTTAREHGTAASMRQAAETVIMEWRDTKPNCPQHHWGREEGGALNRALKAVGAPEIRRNRNFRGGYIADPNKRNKRKMEWVKKIEDMVTELESTIGAHMLVCLATPNVGNAHDVTVVQSASLSRLVTATDLPRLVGLEVPLGAALARFRRGTGPVRLGELSLLEQHTLVRLLLARIVPEGVRKQRFPYKRALPITVHACLNARLLARLLACAEAQGCSSFQVIESRSAESGSAAAFKMAHPWYPGDVDYKPPHQMSRPELRKVFVAAVRHTKTHLRSKEMAVAAARNVSEEGQYLMMCAVATCIDEWQRLPPSSRRCPVPARELA